MEFKSWSTNTTDMDYQGNIYQSLVDRILELVHEYDETMYMPSAIGCLEIAKLQLLQESMEGDEE